jgi:transketolase N-terminal domain/subunit
VTAFNKVGHGLSVAVGAEKGARRRVPVGVIVAILGDGDGGAAGWRRRFEGESGLVC